MKASARSRRPLYGLTSSGEIRQEIKDKRGRKVADRTLVFETFEEEGDLSTRLEGQGLILGETMTQVSLSISLYDPHRVPRPLKNVMRNPQRLKKPLGAVLSR